MGLATFLPLGFLSGWFASFVLKKLNLLRVPPEVEVDGLDTAEYEPDIHVPEFAAAEDLVIEPDGTRVPADAVQAEAARELVEKLVSGRPRRRRSTDAGDHRQRARLHHPGAGTEEARVEDSADFVDRATTTQDCAGFMTFGPGSTYGEEGAGAETAYMVLTWLGIVVHGRSRCSPGSCTRTGA